MTDPTAGASTDPAATSESVTDAPAPDTTPDPSTTTEAADPTTAAPADPAATPSESTAPDTASPPASDAPDSTSAPSTTEAPGVTPDPTVMNRVVTGIDPSVQQGNRVVVQDPITRTNPLDAIVGKIEDHWSNAGHIVSDLRALADELETLLGTLKAGL